jgi:hypothetical protein
MNPVGTLTVSPQPVHVLFGTSGFRLKFTGSVPAAGTATINHFFGLGETQAEVDAYASAHEALLLPPAAIITPPGDGTPAAAPPPAAVLHEPTVGKNGKVKVTRKGKKIVVDTGITVGCPAGGAPCTAATDARTLKAVAAKLKKSKVMLARKTFAIAAGTTKKIVLTFSSKGAKALARNKRLSVKITVVAKVGSDPATTASRTIAIKYPKAKKG